MRKTLVVLAMLFIAVVIFGTIEINPNWHYLEIQIGGADTQLIRNTAVSSTGFEGNEQSHLLILKSRNCGTIVALFVTGYKYCHDVDRIHIFKNGNTDESVHINVESIPIGLLSNENSAFGLVTHLGDARSATFAILNKKTEKLYIHEHHIHGFKEAFDYLVDAKWGQQW